MSCRFLPEVHNLLSFSLRLTDKVNFLRHSPSPYSLHFTSCSVCLSIKNFPLICFFEIPKVLILIFFVNVISQCRTEQVFSFRFTLHPGSPWKLDRVCVGTKRREDRTPERWHAVGAYHHIEGALGTHQVERILLSTWQYQRWNCKINWEKKGKKQTFGATEEAWVEIRELRHLLKGGKFTKCN